MLVNLCTNAADAMAGGAGKLGLKLDTVDVVYDSDSSLPELMPGRYVRLSVRDTGAGIAPSTATRRSSNTPGRRRPAPVCASAPILSEGATKRGSTSPMPRCKSWSSRKMRLYPRGTTRSTRHENRELFLRGPLGPAQK